MGDLIDHFRGRECFRHVSGQLPRPGQMPEQNRKNLMRSHELATSVDRPNAVGIPVEGEARVVVAAAHRLAKRLYVRLDWFRIHASEERVARAADLFGFDSLPLERS